MATLLPILAGIISFIFIGATYIFFERLFRRLFAAEIRILLLQGKVDALYRANTTSDKRIEELEKEVQKLMGKPADFFLARSLGQEDES